MSDTNLKASIAMYIINIIQLTIIKNDVCIHKTNVDKNLFTEMNIQNFTYL